MQRGRLFRYILINHIPQKHGSPTIFPSNSSHGLCECYPSETCVHHIWLVILTEILTTRNGLFLTAVALSKHIRVLWCPGVISTTIHIYILYETHDLYIEDAPFVFNILWPRPNSNRLLTTFSNWVSWMYMFVRGFKCHYSLFIRVQYAVIWSDNGFSPIRPHAIL